MCQYAGGDFIEWTSKSKTFRYDFGQSRSRQKCVYVLCFKKEIERIAKLLQEITVTVTNYRDYEFAQVCTGGIPVTDINIQTLESNLVSNIYFAGEILDVDGICGGYNLHFAWATGYIAGKSVSEK